MIYFFSYGNQNYKNSKLRIEQEAKNMGFDFVKIYGPEDLSLEFLQKTAPHIFHPRGAGYWLWKAYFLKKTFEEMKDGDYCIYADAGCHVNQHGKQRLNEYLRMITDDDSGFLAFELTGFLEKMYTNEKVFEFFQIDESDSYRETSQLVGGVLFLRKCENTVRIINDYYDLALNHSDLFSDIHNDYKRKPDFRDHRHDQSILGLLRKKYGCVIIPDETYALNWKELMHIPILATRIRQ